MSLKKVKRHTFQILEVSNKRGDLSWWVDVFIISLILVNVTAMLLESIKSIHDDHIVLFQNLELFSVAVFSVEYLLRLWTANLLPQYKKPYIGNLKYAISPMAIIDFLAILPVFLPFFGLELRLLRLIRIFRLFRLLKIVRYMNALGMIVRVVKDKREELVISLVFALFLLLISSTLMYHVEHDAQPEQFKSIPHTMWWGIATLTTVGYGDIYPITPIGKVLGGIIAVIGIGLFALPTGILASGFSEELTRKPEKGEPCPTCGHVHKRG